MHQVRAIDVQWRVRLHPDMLSRLTARALLIGLEGRIRGACACILELLRKVEVAPC